MNALWHCSTLQIPTLTVKSFFTRALLTRCFSPGVFHSTVHMTSLKVYTFLYMNGKWVVEAFYMLNNILYSLRQELSVLSKVFFNVLHMSLHPCTPVSMGILTGLQLCSIHSKLQCNVCSDIHRSWREFNVSYAEHSEHNACHAIYLFLFMTEPSII